MSDLKNQLIKLAYKRKDLRPHLLPLLKKAKEDETFEEAVKGRKFLNPETKNEVKFDSLPLEEQKKLRGEWEAKNKKDEESGKGKGKGKGKEEKDEGSGKEEKDEAKNTPQAKSKQNSAKVNKHWESLAARKFAPGKSPFTIVGDAKKSGGPEANRIEPVLKATGLKGNGYQKLLRSTNEGMTDDARPAGKGYNPAIWYVEEKNSKGQLKKYYFAVGKLPGSTQIAVLRLNETGPEFTLDGVDFDAIKNNNDYLDDLDYADDDDESRTLPDSSVHHRG